MKVEGVANSLSSKSKRGTTKGYRESSQKISDPNIFLNFDDDHNIFTHAFGAGRRLTRDPAVYHADFSDNFRAHAAW